MPLLKKSLLTFLILTLLAALFRGPLYRTLVDYESVGLRTNYTVKDEKLTDLIASKVNGKTNLDITEVINLSLSITSAQLHFTADNNDIDPNKLVTSKAAHCVGYAAFFCPNQRSPPEKCFNLPDVPSAGPPQSSGRGGCQIAGRVGERPWH